MKRILSHLTLSLAAFVLLGVTATSARADIVLLDEPAPQGGVGKRPESVLSIQSPKNTDRAFGQVAWNGSSDVITGEIAKRGEHSKTVTFAQAGITSAGQL